MRWLVHLEDVSVTREYFVFDCFPHIPRLGVAALRKIVKLGSEAMLLYFQEEVIPIRASVTGRLFALRNATCQSVSRSKAKEMIVRRDHDSEYLSSQRVLVRS